MRFTGHNILLKNGNTTIQNGRGLLAASAFMAAIKRSVVNIAGTDTGTYKQLKVVDLACLEGGFATEMARMGFDTLGIDSRRENLLKANYVKLNTGLANLNFALDDVRNLPQYGPFDITLCLGILYHLDDPAAYLKTLYQQTNKALIIHTFYAPQWQFGFGVRHAILKLKKRFKKKGAKGRYHAETSQKAAPYIQHVKSSRLGKLTTHQGYNGRWYHEWNDSADKATMETKAQLAYNNHRSFWLCKPDVIKAIYDAGFKTVYQQHDDIDDMASKYPKAFYGRMLLVAVKDE